MAKLKCRILWKNEQLLKKSWNDRIILRIGRSGSIKRQVLFILGIGFFILMLISGVYAATTQNTSSELSTGIIDIKLQVFKINENNEEIEYKDTDKVTPGEVTSFIPKVVNYGEDCYIRVKVEYINNSVDFTEYVTNFSNDFTKYGEYYYYDKLFNKEDVVKIFDSIKIPENVNDISNNKELNLTITVEAMQSKNFDPDYNLDDPWKGIVPTECESYEAIVDNGAVVVIKYNNNTERDITIQNNFWDGIKECMPGDVISDSIMIVNNNKGKTKYYVELGTDGNNEKELELLSQIDFLITDKQDNVIFSGKLNSEGKNLLKELNPKEAAELKFKLFVPFELSNEYANVNSKLVLVFSDDYKEETPPQPTGGGSGGEAPIKQPQTNIVKRVSTILLPRTGDYIDITMIIFLISALGLITTIILDYRERKKNVNSEK